MHGLDILSQKQAVKACSIYVFPRRICFDDCVDSEDVPSLLLCTLLTECMQCSKATGYRNGVLSGSTVSNLGCLHTLC